MGVCNSHLNPPQRRFLRLFGITLLATVVLFMADHLIIGPSHAVSTWASAVSLLTAIPFLGMMLLIPRYLRQEKDEFVRMLVVRALLWGFAVPMVIDTVWGFLWAFWPAEAASFMLRVMPMLNVDFFCITALVTLRMQGRRYQ
jgi:hypothetical protein